jgi:hypothetical protein
MTNGKWFSHAFLLTFTPSLTVGLLPFVFLLLIRGNLNLGLIG